MTDKMTADPKSLAVQIDNICAFTAMKEDDHATVEAAGLPALALLGHFLHEQKRTADALERIAAALEAPEPK